MPETIYPWQRFWVPRDSVIDLSDGGFLRDPTDWLLPVAAGERRWVVIAEQPRDEAYAPIRRVIQHITLAGVCVAFGALGVMLLLATNRRRVEDLNHKLAGRNKDLEALTLELRLAASSEAAAKLLAESANATLRAAESQMVQTEKMAALGQLVAGVAHEINNPLAFVSNNIVILNRDAKWLLEMLAMYRSAHDRVAAVDPELAARVQDLADRIDLSYTAENLPLLVERSREGLRRIQQIVKDLRDFCRQDAVGDRQENAQVNPGIQSTLNIIHDAAETRRVKLVADLADLPGITCSPAKINQVVLNLLSNAIDACAAGGEVTIRTRPDPAGGVAIQVTDTGQGIDPSIRARIFDPFFTTKPPGKGTGLGLSISHSIIAEHGGRIDVDSQVGKGTTMTAHLPPGGRNANGEHVG